MHDIVICPECQRRLVLPAEHVGSQVTCPQCATTFTAGSGRPTPIEAQSTAATVTPVPPVTDLPENDDDAPARKRRKARLANQAKPARRSKIALLFLAGIVCLIVGVGIWSIVHIPGGREPDFAFRPQINPFDDDPPLAPLPAMNPQQNLQDMKDFFQSFSRVIRARDLAAVSVRFDARRAVLELANHHNLPAHLRRDAQFESQLNQAVARAVLQQETHWANHDIRNIRVEGPQELVVLTRHRDKARGGTTRFRWWLTSRSGAWRIYDLEDLDLGMRVSLLMGSLLERGAQNDRLLDRDLSAVNDAALALAQRQDFAEADRQLNKVNVANLPKALAGAHHTMRAAIRLRQQRYEECLASCDEALRCHPDTPVVDYLKAVTFNLLKRHQEALVHARLYHALVGDDPEVCFEMGDALREMRRFKEAATYYRRGLDEDPNHLDSFFQLLRCIGGSEGTHNLDIAERFLKQDRPQDRFEQYAQDCRMNQDPATLEKLALAMRTIEPEHADAAFYLALARADQQKTDEALKAFRAALKLQPVKVRREFYYTEFARVIALQGKALQVYAKMRSQRELAFRSFALALKNAFRLDDLQELIDLHAKENADDPYLLLYQADLHVRAAQFALAEKAYAAAQAKIKDAPLLEMFRPDRVLARYQTGDVLGAYRDIAPAHATFQQLAELCWQDKKTNDLIALVEAHAKNDADDARLAPARWRVKICQGQLDEAGAIMKAALKDKRGAERRQLGEDFLFDMIDADQAAAGYRHALDPSEAFGLMIGELLELQKMAQLQAVCDAHRQQFPKDPLLAICAGQIAVSEKNWAKAAKEWTEAWKILPEPQHQRWQHSYVFARCKAGQALQAYQDTGRRGEIFRDLAWQLLADKQMDTLAQLLEARRPNRIGDPYFDNFEARLKIIRGKPAEAAEQFARCWQNLPAQERVVQHSDFVAALTQWNPQGLEAYTCAPDKRAAFQQLVWRCRNPKHVNEYERLIQEHAKNDPNDPKLPLERGHLHLLRGEPDLAEKQFALAKDKGNILDKHEIRVGLMRARVRLGKVVETYREFGVNNQSFLDLANQCVVEKNPDQLQVLLAVHRQAIPTFKNAAVWELEIRWLKKDYAGAIGLIQADRAHLLSNPTMRWKAEGFLVRGLVLMQKPKEALQEAETLNRRKNGPYLLLALALAATGDVPRVIAYAEAKVGQQRFFIDEAYRDEDLGRILRSEAFGPFRARFPEPAVVNP